METEYIWKVVYKNDVLSPDYKGLYTTKYFSAGSYLHLNSNVVEVTREVKPVIDYRTIETVSRSTINAVIMGAFLLVQANRKIDAIILLRNARILKDDGLKNCKYLVDSMAVYEDYDTCHLIVMDEIYKANRIKDEEE